MTNPKKALKWKNQGIAFYDDKKYDKAIEAFKKSLSFDENDASTWNNISTVYTELKEYDNALEALKNAININPNYSIAWRNICNIYIILEDYENLIYSCNKYLEINPNDVEIWNTLGRAFYFNYYYEKAIDAYKKALELAPMDATLWQNLALACGHKGSIEDAIIAYKKSLEINPNEAENWYNLGVAYGMINNLEDQVQAYAKALEIYPDNASAWYNLGNTYGRMGKHDEAINALEKAIKLNPNHNYAWVSLAIAYEGKKEYDKAIEAYIKSLELSPDEYRAWNALGKLYDEIEEYDKAIEAYQKAKDLNVNDIDILNSLGVSYYQKDDNDNAIKTFLNILTLDGEYDSAWYNLGLIYEDLEEYDKALQAYKKASEIAPDDIDHWNKIIEIIIKKNLPSEVIEKLKQEIDAQNVSAAIESLSLLFEQGYLKEAPIILKDSDYFKTNPQEYLRSLFLDKEKYTFLVGAGISMNPPTNLSSAMGFVEGLIKVCTPENEAKNLLSSELFKYEMLIGFVKDIMDRELTLMDYFDLATEPNLIHMFLAHAILQGHNVLTTNFDYCIEIALKRILPKEKHSNIIPIISKKQYLDHSNPRELIEAGKYPILKLHGSKKNLISGENTFDSLVTTIADLGMARDKGETFAIEPFKSPAINATIREQTLVVLGYSGSDDFDIIPLLQEVTNLKKLIWIDHTNEDDIKIEIITKDSQMGKKLSKVETFLSDMSTYVPYEIVKITSPTISLTENYLFPQIVPNVSLEDNRKLLTKKALSYPRFEKWVADLPVFKKISELDKLYFACYLYSMKKDLKSMLRSSEKGLQIIEKKGKKKNDKLKSVFLTFLGHAYKDQGNLDLAFEKFKESLEIAKKIGDIYTIQILLNHIGQVLFEKEKYDEALTYYEDAKDISDQFNDLEGKLWVLTNFGMIYNAKGEYDKSLESFEEALEISEQIGDLDKKGTILNNIAFLYEIKGQYEIAIEKFELALKIDEKLNNFLGISNTLHNLGGAYYKVGNPEKAMEKIKASLEIREQIGYQEGIATSCQWIGELLAQKDIEEAIKYGERAVKIYQQLGLKEEESSLRNYMKDWGTQSKLSQ